MPWLPQRLFIWDLLAGRNTYISPSSTPARMFLILTAEVTEVIAMLGYIPFIDPQPALHRLLLHTI